MRENEHGITKIEGRPSSGLSKVIFLILFSIIVVMMGMYFVIKYKKDDSPRAIETSLLIYRDQITTISFDATKEWLRQLEVAGGWKFTVVEDDNFSNPKPIIKRPEKTNLEAKKSISVTLNEGQHDANGRPVTSATLKFERVLLK